MHRNPLIIDHSQRCVPACHLKELSATRVLHYTHISTSVPLSFMKSICMCMCQVENNTIHTICRRAFDVVGPSGQASHPHMWHSRGTCARTTRRAARAPRTCKPPTSPPAPHTERPERAPGTHTQRAQTTREQRARTHIHSALHARLVRPGGRTGEDPRRSTAPARNIQGAQPRRSTAPARDLRALPHRAGRELMSRAPRARLDVLPYHVGQGDQSCLSGLMRLGNGAS